MIYCCNVRAGIVQRLERELPKLVMRVRFPLPAPLIKPPFKAALLMEERRESNLGGCNVQTCFGAVSGNACCEGYKLNRSVINPIKKTAPKGG